MNNIIGSHVVSAPGADIKITKLMLSKEAQDGLNTHGARIPAWQNTRKQPEGLLTKIWSLLFED